MRRGGDTWLWLTKDHEGYAFWAESNEPKYCYAVSQALCTALGMVYKKVWQGKRGPVFEFCTREFHRFTNARLKDGDKIKIALPVCFKVITR